MSRFMRNVHGFAIGVSLAGIVFGIWAEIGFLVGWSVFWAAYSTCALRADRKRGVEV